MLIGYEINGQEFRESLITTVTFTQVQGNVVGGTPFVFAQHAPDGKLDMDLGERLRESIKQGRQWTQTYQNDILQAIDRISAEQSRGITKWHNDQMTAISLKGANDRSQIRTQTQREISEIYSSTWKTTQDTSDRMHRRSLETIGEYNTFRDPATNAPVRATIHNNHVWRVGDGRYVSTNDPNFAPANGVQLNRIP